MDFSVTPTNYWGFLIRNLEILLDIIIVSYVYSCKLSIESGIYYKAIPINLIPSNNDSSVSYSWKATADYRVS